MESRTPNITTTGEGGWRRIAVEGDLTYLHLRQIRRALKQALGESNPKNVDYTFDLAQCDFVDSGCMGLLVEFKKEADKRDSIMKIVNAAPHVEDAMKRIGMGKIISITGAGK